MTTTRRININVAEDVDDESAIDRVRTVIGNGRISMSAKGPMYCAATTFTDGSVVEAVKRSASSDTFYVYRRELNEH